MGAHSGNTHKAIPPPPPPDVFSSLMTPPPGCPPGFPQRPPFSFDSSLVSPDPPPWVIRPAQLSARFIHQSEDQWYIAVKASLNQWVRMVFSFFVLLFSTMRYSTCSIRT